MRGFEHQPSDWTRIDVWVDDAGTTHQSVEFVVAGQPIQKGNIIKSKWGAYHDATKGIGEWVQMIQHSARAAMNNGFGRRARFEGPLGQPLPIFNGAVLLEVTLVRERLKSMPKTKTPQHVKKPDLDKLVRGICDGLTGIVYNDDSQVVKIISQKRYAQREERPGAHIKVSSDVVVE